MLKSIMLVSLGAVVGAVARYLLSEATVRMFGDGFPYGTLLVNVVGCLVIGILGGWGIPELSDMTRFLLITGLLGALTTFSTFGWESLELMQNGKVPYLPTGGDPSYVGTEEVPIQPPPVKVKIVAEKKPTPKKR